MNPTPLITIVVPSYNQGSFLGETLQSLVDQQYPRLEVIVQDGGSSDNSLAIINAFVERHPTVFRLFAEDDRGHADALNRGFSRAAGDILGFLNSDDTLLPGCLREVAESIDPRRDRSIVFGRCMFTGTGRYANLEHPATFISAFDQLAIWNRGFNQIPQPSTFWHRVVWERLGGFPDDFDENAIRAIDYWLFCKFCRHFHFHFVDRLWSTYRMHADSVSSNTTEAQWLTVCVRASRCHWGPPWSPLFWRCAISHWRYVRQFHERACHHARLAEAAASQHRIRGTVYHSAMALLRSPRLAWRRLLLPVIQRIIASVLPNR